MEKLGETEPIHRGKAQEPVLDHNLLTNPPPRTFSNLLFTILLIPTFLILFYLSYFNYRANSLPPRRQIFPQLCGVDPFEHYPYRLEEICVVNCPLTGDYPLSNIPPTLQNYALNFPNLSHYTVSSEIDNYTGEKLCLTKNPSSGLFEGITLAESKKIDSEIFFGIFPTFLSPLLIHFLLFSLCALILSFTFSIFRTSFYRGFLFLASIVLVDIIYHLFPVEGETQDIYSVATTAGKKGRLWIQINALIFLLIISYFRSHVRKILSLSHIYIRFNKTILLGTFVSYSLYELWLLWVQSAESGYRKIQLLCNIMHPQGEGSVEDDFLHLFGLFHTSGSCQVFAGVLRYCVAFQKLIATCAPMGLIIVTTAASVGRWYFEGSYKKIPSSIEGVLRGYCQFFSVAVTAPVCFCVDVLTVFTCAAGRQKKKNRASRLIAYSTSVYLYQGLTGQDYCTSVKTTKGMMRRVPGKFSLSAKSMAFFIIFSGVIACAAVLSLLELFYKAVGTESIKKFSLTHYAQGDMAIYVSIFFCISTCAKALHQCTLLDEEMSKDSNLDGPQFASANLQLAVYDAVNEYD